MHEIVSYIIKYCVWSCDICKMCANDKILIENLRKEKKWELKHFFEFPSKVAIGQGVDLLRDSADITYT